MRKRSRLTRAGRFLRRAAAAVVVWLLSALAAPLVVYGHNLQTKMVYMFFDPNTQAMLDARIVANPPPAPLLQVGDELGIIIKVVPRDGTTTGVGGHVDFYVPNGVQVVDVAYLLPGDSVADGITGYDKVPMKGQSLIAIGAGPIGAKSTAALIGLGGTYTNINGVTEAPVVDATGLHRGTIAGVYGDTGIFYSTDPDTAYGSWQRFTEGAGAGTQQVCGLAGSPGLTAGKTITNNSGDVFVPCNKWDAGQMYAWGVKGTTCALPGCQSAPDRRLRRRPRQYALGLRQRHRGSAERLPVAVRLERVVGQRAGRGRHARGHGSRQRRPLEAPQVHRQPGLLRPGRAAPAPRSASPASTPATSALRSTRCRPPRRRPTPPAPRPSAGPSASSPRWCPSTSGSRSRSPTSTRSSTALATAARASTATPSAATPAAPTTARTTSGATTSRRSSPSTPARCWASRRTSRPSSPAISTSTRSRIYNLGSTNLTNVVVRDTLPGGVSFVSAVPAQNSGPNPLVWNVGTLLQGDNFETLVTVRATGTGAIDNTMCVTSDQFPVASCTTETIPSGNYPILKQNKTVTPTTVSPGAPVTYTMRIDNIGSGTSASPTRIEEHLDPALIYTSLVSATLNGASVTPTVTGLGTSNPVFTVHRRHQRRQRARTHVHGAGVRRDRRGVLLQLLHVLRRDRPAHHGVAGLRHRLGRRHRADRRHPLRRLERQRREGCGRRRTGRRHRHPVRRRQRDHGDRRQRPIPVQRTGRGQLHGERADGGQRRRAGRLHDHLRPAGRGREQRDPRRHPGRRRSRI